MLRLSWIILIILCVIFFVEAQKGKKSKAAEDKAQIQRKIQKKDSNAKSNGLRKGQKSGPKKAKVSLDRKKQKTDNRSKWRRILKSRKQKSYAGRKASGRQWSSRQSDCDADPETVCCDNTVSQDLTCASNIYQFVDNIQTVQSQRAVQMDNFDKKYSRTNTFLKLIRNKRKKAVEELIFDNTTETLLDAIGGNISSPTCDGATGDTAQYAMGNGTYLVGILANCTTNVDKACNTSNVIYNTDFFGECGDLRSEILDLIEECRKNEDTEEKCQCWALAREGVDLFKSQSCLNLMNPVAKIVANEKKGECLAAFQACKKAEDSSIGIINTCLDPDTPIISNTRYAADLDEDFEQEEKSLIIEEDAESISEAKEIEKLIHIPGKQAATVEEREQHLEDVLRAIKLGYF